MCNPAVSIFCQQSLCNGTNPLVSICPRRQKRQRYCVLVQQQDSDVSTNVTVIDLEDMKIIPNSACAKEHQLPSGAAFCFGEFDSDCPYVFQSGGFGKYQKTLYYFDVLLGKWKDLGEMIKPHCDHKMHCVNKKLYIIGGRNEGIIEEYDVVKNHRKDKITRGQNTHVRGCLNVSVHNFASAVFGDKIYVFGGISNLCPTKCVQYFDTKTGIVSQLADLPIECNGGSAVVIRYAIYIVTENGHLIRFDPATVQSSLCQNQPVCRKNFTAVARNNKLHVVGGERQTLKKRERNHVNGSAKQLDHVTDVFNGNIPDDVRHNGSDELDNVHESDNIPDYGPNRLPDCSYDPVSNTWKVENRVRSLKVAASCIVEYSKQCFFTPFHKDPFKHPHYTCGWR